MRLGFTGAHLRRGALAAPVVLPRGCFPPWSGIFLAGRLGRVPEVLGVALSVSTANRARGKPRGLVALFGVCFVLAI